MSGLSVECVFHFFGRGYLESFFVSVFRVTCLSCWWRDGEGVGWYLIGPPSSGTAATARFCPPLDRVSRFSVECGVFHCALVGSPALG